MAFNDINAWRRLMESQEEEKRSYDEACEKRKKQAEKDELLEWEALEQPQIDPESMALPDGGKLGLEDLPDDEIDFSQYGIGESDLGVGPADEHYPTAYDLAREPLVRIPAAAGRPVSDADLAAQDVVSLMAEALKKAARLDEKNADTPTDYHNNFGNDLRICIDGMDDDTFQKTAVFVELLSDDGRSEGVWEALVAGYKKGRVGVERGMQDSGTPLSEFLEKIKAAGARRLGDVVTLVLAPRFGGATRYDGFKWDKAGNAVRVRFVRKKPENDGWKKKYGDFLEEGSKVDEAEDGEADFAVVVRPKAGGAARRIEVSGATVNDALSKCPDDVKRDCKIVEIYQKLRRNGRWSKLKVADGGEEFPKEDKADDGEDADYSEPEPGGEMLPAPEPEEGEVADYPLSDEDWEEIDAIKSPYAKVRAIRDKVGDKWESLSPEAKRAVRQDVYRIQKGAFFSKAFEKAVELQRITLDRPLKKDELAEFRRLVAGMSDEERLRLRQNVMIPGTNEPRPANWTVTVPDFSGLQRDNVRDFHAGEDADERSNETGLDTEFDVSKYEYVPEPMAPGTKVTLPRYNPEYREEDTQPNLKAQTAIYDFLRQFSRADWKRVKDAWNRTDAQDFVDSPKRNVDDPAMRESALDTLNDVKTWKFVLKAFKPEEIVQIKNELKAEMPGDYINGMLVDCLFGSVKPTRQQIMSMMGVGGDQKGLTGMGTQNDDKEMNLVMYLLASYMEFDRPPYNIDLRLFRKNLRGESTDQRNVRKEIRRQILDATCDALNISKQAIANATGVMPEYVGERGAGATKAKRAANNLVVAAFLRVWSQMAQSEKEDMAEVYQEFLDRSQIRKRLSGIQVRDPAENEEFQTLISKMREEGDLPDNQRIRLMQLDLMRRSKTGLHPEIALEQARAKYQQMMADDDPRVGEQNWIRYTTNLAKKFLHGQSANVTKDTIRYAQRGGNGGEEA